MDGDACRLQRGAIGRFQPVKLGLDWADAVELGVLQQAPTACSSQSPTDLLGSELARSMGQPDLYPFVLSPPVVTKLDLVHHLIRSAGEAGGRHSASTLSHPAPA